MRIQAGLTAISAAAATATVAALLSACGATASGNASGPPPQATHRSTAHAAPRASRQAGSADAVSAAAAPAAATPTAAATPAAASASPTPSPSAPAQPPTASSKLPPAGNPNGHAFVPTGARAINTSHPTHVVGHGTAASCTSKAVVSAVAKGGIIRFSCGPKPVTIKMTATAKVVNTSTRVVIDGGGKVVLSGMGKRRILYMNTCDKKQVWTTDHCQNQATPRLTVQNLTLTHGRAGGHGITSGSGGAIFAQGGEFKVVNSRFIDNSCYAKGPDLGGAAIRAFEEWTGKPVYIVHSTFTGGVCSNGGALSSIGVSWTVLNSLMAHNRAIGWGANPAAPGTLGGGSGGAIYNDGDTYKLTVNGTIIRFNHAREGGGAIFYVSNDKSGTLHIDHSTLHDNPSGQFHNVPGTIFYIGKGNPVITNSHLDG